MVDENDGTVHDRHSGGVDDDERPRPPAQYSHQDIALDASYKEIIQTLDGTRRVSPDFLKNLTHPCWIDLQSLSDEEIEVMGEELDLHSLTIEEILSNDTPEKCEEFNEYLFIICTELVYSESRNDLVESLFYIILFKEYIVVFHRNPLECFDNVIRSFRYLDNALMSSSEWLLFAFFDSINETYAFHEDNLMVEVQALDEYSFYDDIEYRELYTRLGRASRKATKLMLCLFIKTENINKETIVYLTNVQDRVLRLKKNIKLLEDLLENLKNVYISK
eukprot:gene17511-20891_t